MLAHHFAKLAFRKQTTVGVFVAKPKSADVHLVRALIAGGFWGYAAEAYVRARAWFANLYAEAVHFISTPPTRRSFGARSPGSVANL
jgi:hypothetical protein